MDSVLVTDSDDLSHLSRFYNRKNNFRFVNSSSDSPSFSPRHFKSIQEFIQSQRQEIGLTMPESDKRKDR